MRDGLQAINDKNLRCWWCGHQPDYIAYHDTEWAIPQDDDKRLFEKICLEGFQSGLSWLTILRKRENFRAAFADFDVEAIVRFDKSDVQRLMSDAGIVRHERKIRSVINNAHRAIALAEEFGSLGAFFWGFEPPPEERPQEMTHAALRTLAITPTSTALSKALKKRGWSYVGPTTAYAFMQAMGMVNDHLEGCWRREAVEQARAAFKRPS